LYPLNLFLSIFLQKYKKYLDFGILKDFFEVGLYVSFSPNKIGDNEKNG